MGKGINLDFLDTTTDPGHDFYRFVNGGWLDITDIPSDRSSWGSFHELSKRTDRDVLNILDDELKTPGSSTNLAARLFESGMDVVSVEKYKLSALRPRLQEIKDLASAKDLPVLCGHLISDGLHGIFSLSVHPDLANSHIYTLYLEPGPLGLPERDYYLETDEKANKIRERYMAYVAFLIEEGAGYNQEEASDSARAILNFETELAENLMTKEDRRQIANIYHPRSLAQLKEEMGEWDWELFLKSAQIIDNQQIILTDPKFFQFFTQHIAGIPLETLKSYLVFQLIHLAAPFSHEILEQASFDIYSGVLEGIETMKPRNERIVKVANNRLGELLGQLYVNKHFPATAKEVALEMNSDIVEAFRLRITHLSWMDEATKTYALEKLSSFRVKIGYPDQWKSYTGLQITGPAEGGHYLENLLRISAWKQKEDFNKQGKEVDREEWFMPPQMVNAYYNPLFNEIVFPAAILQSPFFDWNADAAVNYGAIGAVIAHEITHGFDDQGSRFDKEGNYKEWWTETARSAFEKITTKLVQQFDAYLPFEDLPLNGRFTLGENIADLGGLCVAYDALQLYYKRNGAPSLIDGFTSDQRFFMSWATVWRTKIREEALRNQIKTDPHPPGPFRAVAAPSNMDSFYNAFNVSAGSPWYRSPESRIKVW